MKNSTKFLSMILIAVMIFSIIAFPSNASGYTNNTSERDPKKFTAEWEKTRTYKVGSNVIGYMTYGYDLAGADEDYVWTKSTECYSTSMVYRDGYDTDLSYICGPEKGKDKYSKIEVRHKTYYVYYKVMFSVAYTGVTYTTSITNIK